MMGAVDAFNRQLAATHMQMGRCKQRFQRSMFLGWLFPAVGIVNVRIAFGEIVKSAWGEAKLAALKNARGVKVTGFNKWFHIELGKALVRKGTDQAAQANGGDEPHFVPKTGRVHWVHPLMLPVPEGYTKIHPIKDAIDLSKKPHAIRISWDAKGKATGWLGGGKGKGRCLVCQTRCHREGLKVHEHAHKTSLACSECKVMLCRGCWDLYDHVLQRVPPIVAPPAMPPAQATGANHGSPGSNGSPPASTRHPMFPPFVAPSLGISPAIWSGLGRRNSVMQGR